MLNSWTFRFFNDWSRYVTVDSLLRLREQALKCGRNETRADHTFNIRVKQPLKGRVTLREFGTDLGTMREVLIEEVYANVVRHVPKCQTVLDIGANIGMASLYFANSYPGVRIVAVEPHPDTFRILSQNVADNNLQARVTAVHGAVTAEPGVVSLSLPVEAQFSTATIVPGAGKGEVEVQGIPLASLMDQHDLTTVDLLKMDVEGAETEILRAAEPWIGRVRAMAIEFHGDSRQASGFDDLIKRHGFRVVVDEPHTTLAIRDTERLA